jgi:hypothetical protein
MFARKGVDADVVAKSMPIKPEETPSACQDTPILSKSGCCRFDEEKCLKHQWVGRGADGFPSLEGNTEEILGNELCIR